MTEHALLEHLRKDHAEQKEIARRLIEAGDPQERLRLRRQFRDALVPHILGEEASIFERLQRGDDPEARDDALEGLQEHHVAKFVLRELMDLDPEAETFRAKSKVLDELNRHHIREEEDHIFKHLQRLCDDRELDRLFERYEQGEGGAGTRPPGKPAT